MRAHRTTIPTPQRQLPSRQSPSRLSRQTIVDPGNRVPHTLWRERRVMRNGSSLHAFWGSRAAAAVRALPSRLLEVPVPPPLSLVHSLRWLRRCPWRSCATLYVSDTRKRSSILVATIKKLPRVHTINLSIAPSANQIYVVQHIHTIICRIASATSSELRGRFTGGQCRNKTLDLLSFLLVVRSASASEQ
jgi:hypothetical protein